MQSFIFIPRFLLVPFYQKNQKTYFNISKSRVSKVAVILEDTFKGSVQSALKKIRAPVRNLNIYIYKKLMINI